MTDSESTYSSILSSNLSLNKEISSSISIDSIIQKLTKNLPFINNEKRQNKFFPIINNISSPSINKNLLSQDEIKFICSKACEIFMEESVLLEISSPLNICGDIHGQFHDLIRLFDFGGHPPQTNYLFLGDYVDRGKNSIESISLLLSYKIKYKDNFFLLRGNHESENINKIYGFFDECKRRYNLKIWKFFSDCFNWLPVCALIDDKILCMHGGISPELTSLEKIRKIVRPTEIPEKGLLCDLLWSDPDKDVDGWGKNERGVSYTFNAEIVKECVKKLDIDLICRAHQVVEYGYEFFADRTLVTVFSAPNYCGQFDNAGAMMTVDENLICGFKILKPKNPAKKFYSDVFMRSLTPPKGINEDYDKGNESEEMEKIRKIVNEGINIEVIKKDKKNEEENDEDDEKLNLINKDEKNYNNDNNDVNNIINNIENEKVEEKENIRNENEINSNENKNNENDNNIVNDENKYEENDLLNNNEKNNENNNDENNNNENNNNEKNNNENNNNEENNNENNNEKNNIENNNIENNNNEKNNNEKNNNENNNNENNNNEKNNNENSKNENDNNENNNNENNNEINNNEINNNEINNNENNNIENNDNTNIINTNTNEINIDNNNNNTTLK